jgi:hypothetical protein
MSEVIDGTWEDLRSSVIGVTTRRFRVVVERGPATAFARAVLSDDPVYSDLASANAAGFPRLPVCPTFSSAMEYWGRLPEVQPSNALHPGLGLIDLLPMVGRGGVVLHGEQEFVYHRPVLVGDTLDAEERVSDAYQKRRNGNLLTFIVRDVEWLDTYTGQLVLTSRSNVIHKISVS